MVVWPAWIERKATRTALGEYPYCYPMLSAIRSTCKVCRIVGDAIYKNVIRDERLSVKLHNPPLEVDHVVRIKNLYSLHISFLYVKRAPLQE